MRCACRCNVSNRCTGLWSLAIACNKQFYCIIMKGTNRTSKICPTVRNPIRPSFSATNSVLWAFIFLSPCSEKLGSGRDKFRVFSNHRNKTVLTMNRNS